MDSTCARSSASSVPSAYSAASAIWSSLWAIMLSSRSRSRKTETLPDIHHAAAQPCLYRVHRRLEFLRQLLAAPAVVIGKQHQLLPIGLEPADALQKPLQIFRHLAR